MMRAWCHRTFSSLDKYVVIVSATAGYKWWMLLLDFVFRHSLYWRRAYTASFRYQWSLISLFYVTFVNPASITYSAWRLLQAGFYPGTFWGGNFPPKPRNFPPEFLASSDFLDNCLYNFRRDSLIVLVLFLSVSEHYCCKFCLLY